MFDMHDIEDDGDEPGWRDAFADFELHHWLAFVGLIEIVLAPVVGLIGGKDIGYLAFFSGGVLFFLGVAASGGSGK